MRGDRALLHGRRDDRTTRCFPFPGRRRRCVSTTWFRGVEITPLETTEASLLSYPELLKTCRDTLFVFDRSNSSLLLFAPDGKFIRRIGRIGRGPGEYLRARDFLIDPDGRTRLAAQSHRGDHHLRIRR